jgi:Fe-S oxidoreductase
MFPEDSGVLEVSKHIFDPFEYLHRLHRAKKLNTEFQHGLGVVAYQSACHQRVQNIGRKTADVLSLLPDTQVHTIERCTGHDGTYAVRTETHEHSMKIVAPVAKAVRDAGAEYYTSDCPLSANHIAHALGDSKDAPHPISLLRKAYAI